MAEYFLDNDYKDAAAVLVGGVLEEHLRQLCSKHKITATDSKGKPHKADRMNADLAKAQVCTKLEQKDITAWLGLRNNAAHAKYSEYTKDQVVVMLQGVRGFASRMPS